MTTLLIITASYPLGGLTDPGFVGPEVDALCREFDRVIFAPRLDCGEQLPLPPNAELSRAFVGRLSLRKRLAGLFHMDTWRHLWADRHQIRALWHIRSAIASSSYAFQIRDTIMSMGLDLENTLIYNFWFEASTIGAGMIEGAKCVTRAHGHDMYDVPYHYNSHSWRRRTLANLLKVYPASENGADFMRKAYPAYASKIVTYRLGSYKPSGLNPDATSDIRENITFLSIARLVPGKRVPMQLRMLIDYARNHPEQNITWIHVGDGEEMSKLKQIIAADTPTNLQTDLRGNLLNHEVHTILATRHIDALLLLSDSEGGAPIAICEAISYGIPAIATAVGGVPEIVSSEIGALLSPNPTSEEFSRTLVRVIPLLHSKRAAARNLWEQKFDAEKLRAEFARELRSFLPR